VPEYRHRRTPSGPGIGVGAGVRRVAAFALTLVACCLLLNQLVTKRYWRPYLGQANDKVARLKEIADRVDVLFIGTSRVVFGIDPALFDAETATQGMGTDSFNLGVLDLRAAERDDLMASLRGVPFTRLRYVLVEPALNFTPNVETPMTIRMRYHYNWSTVPYAMRVKMEANRPLLLRAASCAMLGRQLALNSANLGVLSDLFFPRVRDDPDASKVVRGYAADTEPPERLSSDRFREQLAQSGGKRQIDEAGAAAPIRELTPTELGYLRSVFDSVRALGAEPIAFFPPQTIELDSARSLHDAILRQLPGVRVLAYYYGQGPAELYEDPYAWMDDGHLSRAGAEAFSRRVARDFVRATGTTAAR